MNNFNLGSSVFWFLLFIGIGLWFLILHLSAAVRCLKSKSWSSVEGTIITSSIDEEVSRDPDSERKINYRLRISYSYEVGGARYVSSRVAFDESTGYIFTKKETSKRQARYPTGKQIKVYYDPNKPQRSTLETNMKASIIYGLFLSLLWVGGGTALYFLALVPYYLKPV